MHNELNSEQNNTPQELQFTEEWSPNSGNSNEAQQKELPKKAVKKPQSKVPKPKKEIIKPSAATNELVEQQAVPVDAEVPEQSKVDGDSAPVEIIEPAKPKTMLDVEIDVSAIQSMSRVELQKELKKYEVDYPTQYKKDKLVYELLYYYAHEGATLYAEGILEKGSRDAFGMLRDAKANFKPQYYDFYVSLKSIRVLRLHTGDKLRARVKAPDDRSKSLYVTEIISVDDKEVSKDERAHGFDKLTAMFPNERFLFDGKEASISGRILDIVAPLGKGQRGLIVAPPRAGKTMLLKSIAKAIAINHEEVELMVLLLDERPEEVSDFEDTFNFDGVGHAQVFASTFDEPVKQHIKLAKMVLERAKVLVEHGKDVVILLDSITRLARAYNQAESSGPIGTGGVSGQALQLARKFFGSARNVEGGGSLTILATALVETESRMDDVIFEEFKGTGNMEVRLDRELSERRIYPAINLPQSGTRNDDRLYHPDEFVKICEIKRKLSKLPAIEAIEILQKNIKTTQNNAELLLAGLSD